MSDKKRSLIIEAAQKRFLHFGVDKTTMNEIADDLSISKASLYYYFPDKLNLYAAVLQKIIIAEEQNNSCIINEKDPLKALLAFLEARTEFIIKYYNVIEYIRTIGSSFPAELQPVFTSSKNRERNMLISIFTNGVEGGIIKAANPSKTSDLLLDCFEGLFLSVITAKQNFFPAREQLYQLLERQKELALIFMKAISC